MKNKLVELVNVSKSFGSTKVLDTAWSVRLWKDNNASYYRWI